MEKITVTDQQRELFQQLIDTHQEIDSKGKTTPYTSINGHMFTVFSSQAKFGIRLSTEEREAFLKKHKTTLLESNGRIMKEYVTVPDKLLAKTKTLAPYLAMSYEYVKSLKPKATKK